MLHHSIIGWLVIGLIAGALGKLIMPGKDPGGIIVTILIGIAGAVLAYYITPLLGLHLENDPEWWKSVAAATAGAVVLLALYRVVMVRRV